MYSYFKNINRGRNYMILEYINILKIYLKTLIDNIVHIKT